MLQAAWERQPLSPACLGGGTCRQEAEVPSSISAPPPSSCKREEAAWEQRAAGVGKGAELGATFAQSSLSSFLLFSPRLTRRGRWQEKASPTLFPRLRACNPPPPSVPTAEQAQPFSAKAQGACSLPQPPPHPRPVPSGGDRQMPCACITQLLSTCQQVTQALCPAPRSRHAL